MIWQGFDRFSGYKAFQVVALGVMLCTQAAMAQDESLMMVSVASEPKAHAKTVEARVTIDAPPELVWEVMTDYPEMKNILPGYEKSNVVKSSAAGKVVDIAMKVAAFLPTYKYQVQVKESRPAYQIRLNRISGDFKALTATYKLVPEHNNTKTRLVYSLNIDPGFNLPGSQSILKNNTEKSLKALERHIEQEARKRLIGQR